MIYLPGTDKQLKFFLNSCTAADKKILIAGGSTHQIGLKLIEAGAASVDIISNNSSDIMDLRPKTIGKNIKVRLMDYNRTDFSDNTFDYIYAQASLSVHSRNKIFKEMLRILKPEGATCIGEIIRGEENVPRYVADIWSSSGISAMTLNGQSEFYKSAGFSVVKEEDLSFTLNEFYTSGKKMLERFKTEGSAEEKQFYKKMISKISHESNAFLSLGGKRFMKYYAFILKRTS